jgi:hypothetical protein
VEGLVEEVGSLCVMGVLCQMYGEIWLFEDFDVKGTFQQKDDAIRGGGMMHEKMKVAMDVDVALQPSVEEECYHAY